VADNDKLAIAAKTLAEMQSEVVEHNKAKGWHDNPVSFAEAMAMLHSEVSEALEAWRSWGLDDATDPVDEPNCVAKPEGVGSEFADVLIRLLDDCYLFGIDVDWVTSGPREFRLPASFVETIDVLHRLIARASDAPGEATRDRAIRDVYGFLRQCCDEYHVDLLAEYERKMTYNATRPWRHGGKRI
jgi:NTP pyrophosphatase (non-canonical NTP hydrolase)